jgi:hypothetical protein
MMKAVDSRDAESPRTTTMIEIPEKWTLIDDEVTAAAVCTD